MIATLDDLFRELAGAGVDYLLAGAAALTLHGVPRLTTDVDLLLEPAPANVARARALFAGWGYTARAEGAVIRCAHPDSPVAAVDLVLPDAGEYAALRGRAALFHLVDVPIPAVALGDLRRRTEAAGRPEDLQDAAGIRILEALGRGEAGDPADGRREQIAKFRRWHTENRCAWLLAGMRLARGLPPDVGPPRTGRFREKKPWKR
jgi:hypothetical protein